MKRLLNILSQTFSILLYPLWMPTFGMVIFCLAFSQKTPLIPAYWWISIGGTFLLTALIPIAIILVAIRRGTVQDLYITNAAERTSPYVRTACCYGLWVYFLYETIHAPLFLTLVALRATFAIALVALINRHWKISAHLTGFGGLTGGILSYFLYYGFMPSITLIVILLAIALLLMYARLWLNAHTDWQVIAGYGLGLLLTTIPTLIISLAHV